MTTRNERPDRGRSQRAAIYCRVSTAAQEDNFSLDTQEAACCSYAVERGWTVTAVFREVHTGAELFERPRLTELREAMRRGEFDVLLVHALDRLSRKQTHQGLILSEAEHAGVTWDSVTEDIDDSPQGQILRAVIGGMAEMERLKIAERTLRGKRARIAAGKVPNSGTELFGYRRDKSLGVRQRYEPEARIVALIFRWYVDDRLSLRAIANRLNTDGIPAPSAGKRVFTSGTRASRWGKTVVHRILNDPTYMGEAYAWRYQRTEHGKVERARDQWVPLPEGTVPALVNATTWRLANDRLAENRGASTRNAARPYLLRGVIHCAICGKRMRSSPERGGHRVYRCSSRETVSGPCGGKRVPADAVEAWVWTELDSFLSQEETIATEVQRRQEEGPDPALLADRESAVRLLAKLEGHQERLLRRLRDSSDEAFPWDLVEREITQLEGEKRQLRETIKQIDGRLSDHVDSIVQLKALQEYCATVRENLDVATFETKRWAVEALVERVVANGYEWRLDGAIPSLKTAGTVSRPLS